MSNLLRVELFKVIRGKVFWVLTSIITAISLIIVTLFLLNEKGVLEKIEGMDLAVEIDHEAAQFVPDSGISFFLEQIHAPDIFLMIIIITVLGSFLIAAEHTTGVLKNTVSIGYRRTEIYMAKVIVYSISSMALTLLFPIVLGIFGSMFFGIGEWPTAELLMQSGKIVLLTCLYVISFSSIVMLGAMIGFGSGITVLISLGLYVVGGPVLNILAHQYVLFEKINHYSVYNQIGSMLQGDLTVRDMMDLAILPLVTTVIALMIGILFFRKKDIQ